MANESPLEQFKQVLTGTARALAHEPEVELAFTADAPTQAGKNFKVPMPGRLLPPEQVAEARGFADSFALKLKHHNAARHAAPCGQPKRLPALRSMRWKMRAARRWVLAIWPGSRPISAMRLSLKCAPIRFQRAQAADEVPISTALSLIVRERLTGAPVPAAAAEGVDMLRSWIEEKAGSDLSTRLVWRSTTNRPLLLSRRPCLSI